MALPSNYPPAPCPPCRQIFPNPAKICVQEANLLILDLKGEGESPSLRHVLSGVRGIDDEIVAINKDN